jgi:hypothetical protein
MDRNMLLSEEMVKVAGCAGQNLTKKNCTDLSFKVCQIEA